MHHTHTHTDTSLVHAYLTAEGKESGVGERLNLHTYTSICNYLLVSALYLGVVTFCHSSATPCAAEEGLTGVLGEWREDSVGCHGQWKEFTPEEVGSTELDRHQYPFTFKLTARTYIIQLILHTCR